MAEGISMYSMIICSMLEASIYINTKNNIPVSLLRAQNTRYLGSHSWVIKLLLRPLQLILLFLGLNSMKYRVSGSVNLRNDFVSQMVAKLQYDTMQLPYHLYRQHIEHYLLCENIKDIVQYLHGNLCTIISSYKVIT